MSFIGFAFLSNGQACDVVPSFTVTNPCFGSATQFVGMGDGDPATWTWNFGDIASANNTATGQNPTHTFTNTNISYTVTLSVPGCPVYTQSVSITTPPVVTLLHDTTVCSNPAYTINASGYTNATYLWSIGDTTSSLKIVNAGRYWLKVTQNGCTGVDTALIKVWGQGNEGNYNWLFGTNGSFNFASNPPTSIANNLISTNGGSSSISSPTGQLLLYTDGKNVYNQNNDTMKNGTGLLGNTSGYQSSIIIPSPQANNIYYIFMVSSVNGLNYSIADLSYDTGYGEITQKNLPLSSSVNNAIASTYDDQSGFWTVAQQSGSDNLLAYHITQSGGLNTTPVTSSVGIVSADTNSYMKFSSDGTKLAIAYPDQNFVEVYNFNKQTGAISNPVEVKVQNPYSLEFSSNDTLLYVSTDTSHTLLQFNLGAKTPALIDSSKYVLSKDPTVNYDALEMTPNGQIYVALGNSGFVGVVTNPSGDTSSAAYVQNALNLGGAKSNTGLPNFVSNYYSKSSWGITMSGVCVGLPSSYQAFAPDIVENWTLNFGDGSPAVTAFDTAEMIGTHAYVNPGTYTVTVHAVYVCGDTTMTTTITIYAFPVVNLGRDTSVCTASSLMLNAQNPGMQYEWSTGASTQQITVTTNGKYYVLVDNNGCAATDTINVAFLHITPFSLGNDTTICGGQQLILQAVNVMPGSSIAWSNGSSNVNFITVVSTNKYYANVTTQGCLLSDTVSVIVTPVPIPVAFGPDVILCTGTPETLDAGNPGFSYLWSTQQTTEKISVTQNGLYWVKVYISSCIEYSDTIKITFDPGPSVSLPSTVYFCQDEQKYVNLYGGLAKSYLWSPTNETTDSIHATQTGTYTLTALDSNSCKTVTSTQVTAYCQTQLFVPKAFSPNGDGINDLFVIYGENIEQFEIDIFDKWGELIFVSHSLSDSWDGTYKGKRVQVDVYTWKITYSSINGTSPNNTSHFKEGNVTVLR